MWDIMAEQHVKYGLLFSPASAGPPIGTSAVEHVMTLAGCSVPNLTNLCRVHGASLRTRALSSIGSACPLNCACGAAGTVRSANSSKSRASSIKVTAPGSSAHCKARSQRSKSVMKPTCQGQVCLVGLCRETIGVAEERGSGPISY